MEIIIIIVLSLFFFIATFIIIKITNNSTAEINQLYDEREELQKYIDDLFEVCKMIENSSIISEDELVKLLYKKVMVTSNFLKKNYIEEINGTSDSTPNTSGS